MKEHASNIETKVFSDGSKENFLEESHRLKIPLQSAASDGDLKFSFVL